MNQPDVAFDQQNLKWLVDETVIDKCPEPLFWRIGLAHAGPCWPPILWRPWLQDDARELDEFAEQISHCQDPGKAQSATDRTPGAVGAAVGVL